MRGVESCFDIVDIIYEEGLGGIRAVSLLAYISYAERPVNEVYVANM